MNEGYTIPVLDSGYVRYIGHYGSDMTIVNAARISYQGTTKGEEADKKLLHYLWKNKHTSPFEMVKIHLNIKMPIFVMRQYVRHRMPVSYTHLDVYRDRLDYLLQLVVTSLTNSAFSRLLV